MSIKAADIMTRTVVTTGPEATVKDIARMLSDHDISAVPVCDKKGLVVGMVSEGDLLRPFGAQRMQKRAWWLTVLAEGTDLAPEFIDYIETDSRTAAQLMTRSVITGSEETSLPELADLMTQHRVKRIPILRDGALVGIVSRSDVVRALAYAPAEP